MAQTELIPLNFLPGIQRDGTDLDGQRAIDAKWCRWRMGRPRKMLGYESIFFGLRGTPRRLHLYYAGSETIVHVGTSVSIERFVLDRNGNVTSHADRTPAGFEGGPNVGWTIDSIYDATDQAVQIVAHAVPDLDFLSDQEKSIPLIGRIGLTSDMHYLTPPADLGGGLYTPPSVSGGIVVVQPYLMDFDDKGFIGWSPPNNPASLGINGGTLGAGSVRASSQKIVQGMPLRSGGTNTPAALFWSLSELIMLQFIGSDAVFRVSTISPSSSILSSDSVIEYDGLYFWAGTDRFLVFNGTVAEVPNAQNQDWFFDNINRRYASKTFAFKVPRFGEIWWCAPLFGATEPSHAIIFNVRDNVWYDTELPAGGRTAGFFAQGMPYPIMGSPANGSRDPGLWLHEKGLNAVAANAPTPIESYFETPYLAGPAFSPPSENEVSFDVIEPDIEQSGDLTITLSGKANARDADEELAEKTLKDVPGVPQDEIVEFKNGTRLPKLRFTSNCLNGNYILGKTVLRVKQQGKRMTGGVSATKGQG